VRRVGSASRLRSARVPLIAIAQRRLVIGITNVELRMTALCLHDIRSLAEFQWRAEMRGLALALARRRLVLASATLVDHTPTACTISAERAARRRATIRTTAFSSGCHRRSRACSFVLIHRVSAKAHEVFPRAGRSTSWGCRHSERPVIHGVQNSGGRARTERDEHRS
jgi:hypothetical protein